MVKKSAPKTISNRRASFDYELDGSITAGVVLNGRETKSLRMHHGHLKGAFVTIRNNEAWLMNATITSSPGFVIPSEEQTIPRKLLLNKKELQTLKKAKDEGKTIVPLEFLTSKKFIKLRISTGKGKKTIDKRRNIQKRDLERQEGRAFKNRR